ncbi:MAG TPA: hypothetical protein VNB54_11020 [Alphaproteobacteria bacterium]|nr:hypothetical protein [Alphaproteobacteria bacterium]
MAVHKATRSKSSTQLQSNPTRRRPDPQRKAEIFDTLRLLNRGYGSALAALHRLQYSRIFSRACLNSLQNRTEALRAFANRDLLRLFAGREDRDASRFSRFTGEPKRQQPTAH